MPHTSQEMLGSFLPDPIEHLNSKQRNQYNFLQGKIRLYKQLRRTAAEKNIVDKIINVYRLEVKKLIEK